MMGILLTGWSMFRASLYARIALVAVITFGAWQADRAWQRTIGERVGVKKAETTIRKANDQAVTKSGRARRKSTSPSVRGKRDPSAADS